VFDKMSAHDYTEDHLACCQTLTRPLPLGEETVEQPAKAAAPISGKWRGSTRFENRYSSETPSVKGGFSVNEWLSAMRCKLLIPNMFLFE
jgi:hypothetical protein